MHCTLQGSEKQNSARLLDALLSLCLFMYVCRWECPWWCHAFILRTVKHYLSGEPTTKTTGWRERVFSSVNADASLPLSFHRLDRSLLSPRDLFQNDSSWPVRGGPHEGDLWPIVFSAFCMAFLMNFTTTSVKGWWGPGVKFDGPAHFLLWVPTLSSGNIPFYPLPYSFWPPTMKQSISLLPQIGAYPNSF